jgi:hypothetical protein
MDAKCPYCKRRSRRRNARNLLTSNCGMEGCKRAHAAAQKRNVRARNAAKPDGPPPPPDYSGPVTTPFGDFDSAKEAWFAWHHRRLSEKDGEWLEEHYPDAEPTTDELLIHDGMDPIFEPGYDWHDMDPTKLFRNNDPPDNEEV